MLESRYPADIEKGPGIPTSESAEGDSVEQTYTGMGTVDDPYVVDWDLDDPEDPYNWAKPKKWLITAQVRVCSPSSESRDCLLHIFGFRFVGGFDTVARAVHVHGII
jgi:hypothetical protein